MKTVRADLPTDWADCRVYILADEHIGDAHAMPGETARRIEQIADDPHGVCVLNGDLLNCATRNSVSDVYAEKLTPTQAIINAAGMLEPIKGKIIGVTCGNHESRIWREDGVDVTKLLCRELGVEDKYAPQSLVIFLRFGTRNSHGMHKDKNPRQLYTLFCCHGSGGGRKEGPKATRLADMACIVDADCYIHSHTHLPMVFRDGYFRTSAANSSVKYVDRLYVNTAASLGYGGYGQAQEFKPSSIITPHITFQGDKRHFFATL